MKVVRKGLAPVALVSLQAAIRMMPLILSSGGCVKLGASPTQPAMHLDRKSRAFLMGALARNAEGFGVFVEDRGWMIAPMWKYPFTTKSE